MQIKTRNIASDSLPKFSPPTMIFQLIDDGKLSLDTKLAKYYLKVKNAEMADLIEDLESDFTPDSAANYSNSGYVMLGFILEDIYINQLQTRISIKLNLVKTVYSGQIDVKKSG